MSTAISVEGLCKSYRLGQIGTGTLTNDLKVWWAARRGKPNPLLRIGEPDHRNRSGEEIWALRDINFSVQAGETLGIIGRNGAGKSTLLKVLSRITAPTSGTVRVKGRIASLLEVGTGFHPDLTGRENTYLNGAILGMSRREIDRKFDEIVDFSGVEKFIDTPVKRYSSGMYVRLAFAVAAHLEPEILLVDEVLAVGDAEFQKKCLGKMGEVAGEGRTVLFVSHNMESILTLCESCFLLAGGQIVQGGKSAVVVSGYIASFAEHAHPKVAHVLYDASDDTQISGDAQIMKVEILDPRGQPKPLINTWDDMVIRVSYRSKRAFKRGTFILDIFDARQQRLVVLDSGQRLPIETGLHYVDCRIPQLPLAAGQYFLGAGLAVSNTQWLWRETNIGVLRVHAKDVFGLGRPPEAQRMLMAVPHQWFLTCGEPA